MTETLVAGRIRDLPVRRVPVLVTTLPVGVQGPVKITGTLRRCW
jgi:hypothetical protein